MRFPVSGCFSMELALSPGGMFSVGAVPAMGLVLHGARCKRAISPPELANWFMAAGFGGLHIVFGAIIVRKYGG